MDLSKKGVFRIVLIGDPAVGKTSIVNRLHNGVFSPEEQPTIGSTFINYTVPLENESANLQIWDTAGEEQYRSVGPIYYKRAQAAIIVYDVTIKETFTNLSYWITEFKNASKCQNDDIFIVGNKVDLIEHRQVEHESGNQFASTNGFNYLETSAKTGEGVVPLFQSIANHCLSSNHILDTSPNVAVSQQPQQQTWCC